MIARHGISKLYATLSRLVPPRLKMFVSPWARDFLRKKFSRRRDVNIDIVGSCNLGCPSCPSGRNSQNNKGGRMSLDLFKDIVGKVSTEYPGSTIALYNWTEPLLHSQVPDFIKVIHDFGLNSRLSTHLNVLPNAKGLAEANPGGITISLSGFTQKVYEIGHKDGDIETVKQNMCILSDALQKAKSTTEVSVYYHKYLHNLDEEAAMKDFSTRLGFSFGSSWAFYMPLEKVDAYIQDKMQGEESEFLKNRFALNIKRAVDSTRPFRNEPCSIKSSSLTINCRGIVQLCCAVYDENKFSIQSYLETSSAELEKIIDQHSYCRKCMNKGLHIYSTWHGHQIAPIYEKIVQDEIEAEQTARF